jgi:hypothetical protein
VTSLRSRLLFLVPVLDHETGWLGYDLIVNRNPVTIESETDTNSQVTSMMLEKNIGDKYEWDLPIEIVCCVTGNELELAIPIATLTGGKTQLPEFLRFKWADNTQQTGE